MYLPTECYKPTRIYRALIKKSSIKTSPYDHFRYEPNYNPSGTTWDAKHMDRFLKSTKWGNVPSIPHLVSKSQSLRSSSVREKKNDSVRHSVVLSSNRSSVHKKEEEPTTYRKLSGYEVISDRRRNRMNPLVADLSVDQDRAARYYLKEFGLIEKCFDDKKLEYSDQPELSGSRERRSQLVETKRNQEELAKWKRKRSEVNRRYSMHKNAFQSGILGVDNPNNEKTMLYKEEHARLLAKREKVILQERERRKFLTDISLTNPVIEVSNKNFDTKTTLPLLKISEGATRKPVKLPFVEKWENSEERLFNQPLKRYSVERASFLREKELRGRSWDIITSRDNSVEIKVQPEPVIED